VKSVSTVTQCFNEEANVEIIVNARNFGHIHSPLRALHQTRGDTAIGIFFFSSVQLISMETLGKYIGAIHTQVQKRPLVVERERVNFEHEPGLLKTEIAASTK
jgi:hypothetical protein